MAVGGGRGRGEGGAWRGRQLWLGRVALHHITMFDIYIPDFLRLRVVYLISASCWLHMRQPSSSSILSIPNLDPNLEAPLCQRFFFFSLFLSPPRFHFLHPSSLPLPSPVVFPFDDSCSHPLYVSPFIPYLLISLSFSLSLRCHHYNAICNSPSVSLSRTISTIKRRKAESGLPTIARPRV